MNGMNHQQAIIPVGAMNHSQALVPIGATHQPIIITPQSEPIRALPPTQQQPIIMAPPQSMLIGQQAIQGTVMTNYGPVPLLRPIPVIPRVHSQPNMRGHRTPQPIMRPMQQEGPIVEFPEYERSMDHKVYSSEYGRTMDRKAYSDMEQHIRLNDEIDNIYGSVGVGGGVYGGSVRSAGRSRHGGGGGSVRSRGTYGQSSRRSQRSQRSHVMAANVDDVVYEAGPGYTVIEQRIPAAGSEYRY